MLVIVAATLGAICAPQGGRTPTAAQLDYQRREVTMFVHFSMCTFAPNGGCEQDTACLTNPPSLFDPGDTLNTSQWAETAVKMGAKEVCLTAHHTGGFALFQSNYTNYSIRQSPYQGGHGDIVRDFTASCRAYGLSPCLYFINAWDCWEAHHDTADVYLERTLGMLSELSNREVYGKIDRFWFDEYGFGAAASQAPPGLFPAAWPKIVQHVHSISPGTMMLPGPDGCLNPGEGGGGAYPVVNYANDTLLCSYHDIDTLAAQDDLYYTPYESDISIQNPGDAWFYHKGHVFDSASQLFEKYLAVVGRGSHFIVNMPPNRSGLIVDEFVASAGGLGDAVRRSFGMHSGALASPRTAKCAELNVTIAANGPFDTVVLQEGLTRGQTITGYTLELLEPGATEWSPVLLDPKSAGQTLGSKGIVRLSGPSNATAVRFACTRAIALNDAAFGANLSTFSLHTLAPPKGPPPTKVSLRSYWSEAVNDTAPCATRDGGSCSTYTGARYVLLREEALVLSNREMSDPATKVLDLVYSVSAADNGLSDFTGGAVGGALDPVFAPTGYVDEPLDKMAVYVQGGPGRTPLESYYSSARKDFWVVGCAASKAEAISKGYTRVGLLGYGLLPSY